MTLSRNGGALILLLSALAALLLVTSARGQTPDQFRRYIQVWEGFSVHPVTRANGETVVGWGHNCRYDLPHPLRHTYSEADLYLLFERDYWRARATVRDGIRDFDSLPLNDRLVALSVAWCVGPTGFQHFTAFRTSLSYRLYTGAAMELQRSLWARQVGRARLVNHVVTIRNTPSTRSTP